MLRETIDDIMVRADDTMDRTDGHAEPQDGFWSELGGGAGGDAGDGAGEVSGAAARPAPADAALPRFWRERPPAAGERDYGTPPLLPGSGTRPGAAEGFRPLKQRLAEKYPLRAEALEWRLLTEPLAASQEQEALLREADERGAARRPRAEAEQQELLEHLERLRGEQGEAARELAAAREAFGDALSDAGLPWIEGEASPAAVEAALQEATPDPEELAGEHGMAPPAGETAGWRRELLGCLASGLLLALCLGSLVGLVSLADVRRGDGLPALALAVLVGAATSSLLGDLAANAAGSLAQALGRGGPDELRTDGALAVALGQCAFVALLLAAEVVAEAIGMRELHGQALQARGRLEDGPQDAALLPLAVYALPGLLITGPYLGWKAAKGWAQHHARAGEAWLWARQREWLQERRGCPEVRRAFALAARAEGRAASAEAVERRTAALERRRDALLEADGLDPETRARLDDARAAAVGLSSEFQDALAGLIDEVEPLPQKRRPGLFGWRPE